MDRRIVRVRSLQGGHHRIGRFFGPEEVDIEARTLSRKELASLQSDPDLCVRFITEGEDTPTGNPAE